MSATISKPSNQNQEVTKSARHWPQACHATSNRDGQINPSNQKNAYTPVKVDPSSDYVTPGAFELEQLFWSIKGAEYTHVNEVWPRLFIGDEKTALERPHLEMMGMTHVLNAAEGKWNSVDTGALFYQGMNIQYHGVQAQDVPSFNLAQFFQSAVDFMHQALNNPESKVLVHCVMGRSRSATLVVAYLMIHEGLSVVEAIKQVRRNRCVLPNRGFIKQLRALDIALQRDRQKARETDKSLAC